MAEGEAVKGSLGSRGPDGTTGVSAALLRLAAVYARPGGTKGRD